MGRVFADVGPPTIRLNDGKTEYKNDFDIRVTLADLAPPKKAAPKKK